MIAENSVQKQPLVARIDYLYNGGVGDSVEYTDADRLLHDVKEQNEYGVPMSLVLFADANGETIPRDFIQTMDPPPHGVTVMYTNVPVYYQNYEYAVAHGEEAQYRGSMNVTQACKRAIERAISEHYNDHRLPPEAVNGVIDRFGLKRTMCVLANTIRELDWDARFNTVNKQWAAGIQIPDNPGMPFAAVNSHPGLVDLFTNSVRRCYVRSLPLTEADIHAEAERILEAFRSLPAPNSPSGKFYTVKISEEFMLRAGSQHTTELQQYLPFRSLCLTTLKGQKGFHAMIHGSEDRSKPLRDIKTPAKKKSSQEMGL